MAVRVTMSEVARRAGVSPMTVSYCYSRPERVAATTRRRVLRVAERLGYSGPDAAGRALRTGRSGTIGVLLGEHLTYAFDDPQAARFLGGVAERCREDHTTLTLIPTDGDDAAERVSTASVDGFVVWTTTADDPVLAAAVASRRPVVVHGGPGVDGAELVTIDDRAAARAAAEETFAGAARPAVLSFPLDRRRRAGLRHGLPSRAAFPVTRARLAGVRDHCRAAGIDPSGLLVAVADRNDPVSAAPVVEALLDERPDAVLAMSDQLALEVLRQLRSRGSRVPADVRVSGWDDSADAEPAGLTSVRQSPREQGRRCAELLLDPSGADPLPPVWSLIRRSSTGAVPT